MRKIKNAYYKVVIGIKNILYYLPLIWEDRSWDYTYNYKFLRVKLEKQRRDILKYSNHVNATNDARRLFICVELFKRLENKDYADITFEKRSDMEPLWIKLRSGVTPMNTRISKMTENYEHQDIDLLATYLKKYGSGWWY